MELRRDIYLIFKEAVNNAVKYSGAKLIDVSISTDKSIFNLMVRDNGIGFDPITIKKGNGLDNMQRRTEIHKGTFSLQAKSGGGTQVSIFIPIP
jgi:signal transduction histidine kinase